jgi:photosystem II stability/assembly factor-like uncharacterized protein
MLLSSRRVAVGAAIALACATVDPSVGARAADPAAAGAAVKRLAWRSIGPANAGGRVAAIEGIPGDPTTFFVVPANGGIFRTTNGGTTFQQIFAQANVEVASVGALAIAASDHAVMYAGTGEGDPRNSASFGVGVYKTIDGGTTWKHVGLRDSERIKRIRVHPSNPDVAYVCAMGHAWGANEERGVFRTTDGGSTWQKVLYRNADTGCSDIDMDPSNPRVLFAGMYTFRRKPWRFDSGGGETALYKTTDGGTTWNKVTQGLPKGPMDRIGVAIAASDPSVVYLVTEAKGPDGGELFRSDDHGETWRMVNDDPNIDFRPFYYSDLRVDPNDPNRVYSLSGSLNMSRDGGRTFERIAANVHGDHQAMWIDPKDSNRVLSGSDGGFQVSYDGAKTFEIINNIVMTQFYHVAYDLRTPFYHVCGGLQDNGTWCGPSQTNFSEGIRKDDWYTVGGGDGFFAVPDLSAPDVIYSNSQGGSMQVIDVSTGMSRNIVPYPKEVGSTGSAVANYKYRFNWNSPIVLSPQDPQTVYFGGNVVFRSRNRGQSWDVISPDLTTNDKSKQQSSGGPVTVDNTAAEFHCTILTIAESPVKPGVIWVGTDDGNIQVTTDAGKTWKNVVGNVKGLPPNSWVPAIDASHVDAGTAYVAVDRHQDDDFGPWAFKTTDYGQTWTAIKGDLPKVGYVHVVREDPKNRNLLYAGTETGVFASWDGGTHWVDLRNNLPHVAVNDLIVHPRDNDLIIATHSRGMWILDDITPLQKIADAMNTDAFVFEVRPSSRFASWNKDNPLGNKTFVAENPPAGAYIDYYLKDASQNPVAITIVDGAGKTVRQVNNAPRLAGVNRYVWDLRFDTPQVQVASAGEEGPGPAGRGGRGAAAAGGGGGGRFGRGGGIGVLPGEYTAVVKAGGRELRAPIKVSIDPRVQVSEADLRAQFDALVALRDLTVRVNGIVTRTESLIRQLETLEQQLGRAPRRTTTGTAGDASARGTTGGPGETPGNSVQDAQPSRGPATDVRPSVEKALQQLHEFQLTLVRECNFGYRCGAKLREEIQSLSGGIGNTFARPTEGQALRIKEVTADTDKAAARLDEITRGAVGDVNKALEGTPHIR